jgi:hypothetical protein
MIAMITMIAIGIKYDFMGAILARAKKRSVANAPQRDNTVRCDIPRHNEAHVIDTARTCVVERAILRERDGHNARIKGRDENVADDCA